MYNFKSKKGMKFNKLTHLTIVVVLAIVFIVVYLYYTIRDVKKIHNEVQKLTANITDMNTSITNITSTLIPLLSSSQNQTQRLNQRDVVLEGGEQCAYVPTTDNVVDDESSVNSQELKTIMETIEDEEKEVVTETQQYINDVANLDDIKDVEEMINEEQTLKDAPKTLDITKVMEVTETTSTDFSVLSVDELKKVSYEQLRKYCKNNDINYKGTKDVLIYRIKGISA
jgi:hypothetical protein